MPYVIGQPCMGVKDAACVSVCPVDCIHTSEEEEMYFIDPDECIDCGACMPVCPVEAIFPDDDIPEGQEPFVARNEDFFKRKRCGPGKV